MKARIRRLLFCSLASFVCGFALISAGAAMAGINWVITGVGLILLGGLSLANGSGRFLDAYDLYRASQPLRSR